MTGNRPLTRNLSASVFGASFARKLDAITLGCNDTASILKRRENSVANATLASFELLYASKELKLADSSEALLRKATSAALCVTRHEHNASTARQRRLSQLRNQGEVR